MNVSMIGWTGQSGGLRREWNRARLGASLMIVRGWDSLLQDRGSGRGRYDHSARVQSVVSGVRPRVLPSAQLTLGPSTSRGRSRGND